MKAIYLVPFGTIDDEVISALEICVWQIFGYDVRRVSSLPDPAFARDSKTGQYSSTLLLQYLLQQVPDDAERVLGVTDNDLFIPMLSFVFGHAQVNGPVAVISLTRLRQEFYHLPVNKSLFIHRVMKEAVHELGHTFGLIHCSDAKCAMSLSNAIQQVDKKTEELCADCSLLFEEYTKHNRRESGMEIHR